MALSDIFVSFLKKVKVRMSLKKQNRDLLSGSLVRNMLLFTLPVIMSGVLQLVFNAADLIVVGKFDTANGSLAQAAIGSTGPIINLIVNVFIGISVGVNVIIARLIGSKSFEKLKSAVQTSMLLGLIAGAAIAVIGVIFTSPLLRAIGTEKNVTPLAKEYLQIYFLGAPFAMVCNFGSAVMRAYGDTKRPMIYLAIGGVFNVAMNLITVIGLDMGAAGVAIATTASNFVACLLTVAFLIKTNEPIRLHLKGMKINFAWVSQMVKIGLPAGIQGSLFSISNVLIQAAVNSFQNPHITAGNGNASNIEGFIYVSMNAFYQTAITFTGQCCGAGKHKLLRKIYFTVLALVAVTGIVLGYGAYFIREPLMMVYSSNKEDIAAGVARLSVIMLTYFLCGMMDVTTGVIRGMGNSIVPMIISLIGACGFRIVWIYTVFKVWKTTTVLYISYPISWALTFLALFLCSVYYRRKFTKNSVLEKG